MSHFEHIFDTKLFWAIFLLILTSCGFQEPDSFTLVLKDDVSRSKVNLLIDSLQKLPWTTTVVYTSKEAVNEQLKEVMGQELANEIEDQALFNSMQLQLADDLPIDSIQLYRSKLEGHVLVKEVLVSNGIYWRELRDEKL